MNISVLINPFLLKIVLPWWSMYFCLGVVCLGYMWELPSTISLKKYFKIFQITSSFYSLSLFSSAVNFNNIALEMSLSLE